MKKIIIIVVLVIVIPLAYWLLSPLWRVVHVDEAVPISTTDTNVVGTAPADTNTGSNTTTQPSNNTVSLSGTFVNGVHDVSGTVRVIDTGTEKILRFENFKTLNGPDLHIYLSADNTNRDFIEISKIKATEGNINYTIPSNVDLAKYNHVLVWCETFRVLFGSAALK